MRESHRFLEQVQHSAENGEPSLRQIQSVHGKVSHQQLSESRQLSDDNWWRLRKRVEAVGNFGQKVRHVSKYPCPDKSKAKCYQAKQLDQRQINLRGRRSEEHLVTHKGGRASEISDDLEEAKCTVYEWFSQACEWYSERIILISK